MVAVVSGNGLGLFNSSLTQLGSGLGSSSLGQSRESQLVNIATGNLILQDQDENLTVRGLNTTFLRTYNSRGIVTDAGQDGFVTGYERNLVLTGTPPTLNAPGSTITVNSGDGEPVRFDFISTDLYTSTSGDGAHDTLRRSADGTWTLTEGSSLRQELYADLAQGGRLTQIRNWKSDGVTPAVFDVIYNGSNQVIEVRSVDGTGASADAILFTYSGAQLASVSTREDGVVRSQVSYEYDGVGRLKAVQHDLTPADAMGTWDGTTVANNDALRFRTEYTYVTASATDLRIASVRQGDGTLSSYTYEADGVGGFRVKTVTLGDTNAIDTDGAGETVTLTYGANSTDVTDSLGRTWTYKYDANKQLTEVDGPAIDGLRDVTTYQYDTAGNLTQVKSVRGAVTLSQNDYAYDAQGNQTWQWDAQGNAVSRTYTATNQLASSTSYTGVDPDRTGATLPTGGMTSYFLYGARDRLQYAFDATGAMTEYTYATSGNGIGQRLGERRYLAALYTGATDEASMRAWAASASKVPSTLVQYSYDAKGRLSQSIGYACVDQVTGAGVLDAAAEQVSYTYDAQGLLLKQITLRGAGPNGNSEVVDYVYDGLGRLLSVLKHDSANATPTDAQGVATTYAYTDSGNKIVITLDTGATSTQTFNAAHRLLKSEDSGVINGATVIRTTLNYYDTAGQLRASKDAALALTYFFYDAKGSLVGEVDGTGAVTEYTRDALGRVVDTITYPTRVDTTSWLVNGAVAKNTIAEVRPVWSTTFDSLPITGLYTDQVNNPANNGVLTLTGGKLVFDVNATSAEMWPVVIRDGSHALTENVSYSAEITTGATQNNTYLLLMLENAQSWGANYRRSSVHFRNGELRFTKYIGTTATETVIGNTLANTTYVVETRTRNGRIEYTAYVKGQDPSTGWTFGMDATPAEWVGFKFSMAGYGGVGQVGDALSLDNLSESSVGVRHNSRTYDTAGRLATETDATNLVTTYVYDAASRLISTSVNQTGAPASSARVTRMFYDDANRLLATLDSAGYLTESVYDNGGRLIKTVGYYTQTSSTYWSAGTLTQLRPLANDADTQCRYFYDGRGRVVSELKLSGGTVAAGQGYLTDYVYDEANNQRAVKEYSKLLTALDGTETLSTLRSEAVITGTPTDYRLTQRSFNGLGQLVTELNAEGTVTKYTYDEAGRLVQTTANFGAPTSEVRDSYRRFDVFGNLIGELSGEQFPLAIAFAMANYGKADSTLTDAQQNTVFNQFGITHCYDLVGQRIDSRDQLGNKTWYFYDNMGRNTYTVRGVANGATLNASGEVIETRYDAFGQVTDTLTYTGRITIGGTQSRADVQTAINVLTYVAASDSRRQYSYDIRGLLTRSVDATGVASDYSYTAFGQLYKETRYVGTTAAVAIEHGFDNRGLETSTLEKALDLSVQRSTTRTYDAFGRAMSLTDARGVATTTGYDRLGRQILQSRTVDGRGEWSSMAYDAFDRVVTQLDAAGRQTTYSYNDQARSMTITSPGGVVVTTTHNTYGQTVSVVNAYQTSTFTYNLDGNLVHTTEQGGWETENKYDDPRGLLTRTIDQDGHTVDYTYDAAGRVLTRTVDAGAGHLNLTTTYACDAQGRQLTVTDASGRVTSMSYDQEGRLTKVTQDPSGLNLQTVYAYDAAGRQVSVTEGFGTAAATITQYNYDVLGRRTSEVRSPGVLNLTVGYTYDGNGNVLTRTDETNNVTRYFYNEDNQLRFAIDALGGVTETSYDLAGRAVMSRTYAKALTGYTGSTTVAAIQALMTAQTTSNDATDSVVYRIFDGDNRLLLTVDGMGSVKTAKYDSIGRVCMEVVYAQPVSMTTTLRNSLKAGGVLTSAVVGAAGANDQVSYTWHDGANRTITRIDSQGNVRETYLNGTMQQTGEYAYATPIAGFAANTTLKTALANGVAAYSSFALVVDTTKDLQSFNVYDAAGRVRYSGDASGAITGYVYDAAGRVIETKRYVTPIAMDAALWNQIWFQDPAAIAAIDSKLALVADAAKDRRDFNVYDAAGRVRFSGDASGAITSYTYDAAGRVTEAWRYITPITMDATLWSQIASNSAAAITTISGRVPATAQKQINTYDGAGRLTQVKDALNYITQFKYDKAGRLIATIDARGNTSRSMYDAAGQKLYDVDQAGGVTRYWYDATGRVSSIAKYSVAVTGLTDTSTAANVTTALGSTAIGLQTYYVRNAEGQVRFTIDALGNVVENTYDGAGQQVSTRRYTNTVAIASLNTQLTAGTKLIVTPPAVNNTTDQFSYVVYDNAGRVRYSVTSADGSNATVSERRYDAAGLVVAEVAYGVLVANTLGTIKDATLLGTAITNAGGNSAPNQRLTRYAYGLDGNLRFTIADDGSVTEQRYNALGQVSSSRVYGDVINVVDATEANVKAAVNSLTARVTSYTYDVAGRVKTQTDALSKVETFGYDAVGNRTSYINKLGSTWTYEFDAAGRMTKETSPPVSVARFDATGTLVIDPNKTIITVLTYDGVGNLASRTENWGAAEARTTTYEYDVCGNQIKTKFPDAMKLNGNAWVTNGAQPETNVTYNALGQAVVQKDVRGGYSYKVYNVAGQVAYDIDADGCVTGYTYDSFGQQIGLTRYATALNKKPSGYASWVEGQAITAAQVTGGLTVLASTDRGMTVTYDSRGNKLSVEQSTITYYKPNGTTATASPRTEFQYNAYGSMVRQAVLVEGTTWAYTYIYYDKLGQRTLSVDAEGFVTTWEYNALGELSKQSEFAKAIATGSLNTTTAPGTPTAGTEATGRDRITSYTYDSAGRKITETVKRWYQNATGATVSTDVQTKFEYDAIGNLTATELANNRTVTEYDALGHAINVTEQARDVLASNWQTQLQGSNTKTLTSTGMTATVSPYTAMTYDAFGNVAKLYRSALGKQSNGTIPTSSLDQTTITRFDRQGRVVLTTDPTGKAISTVYDAADNVLQQSYKLVDRNGQLSTITHTYTYDASNRQLTHLTERKPGAGATVTDAREAVAYNAFGEITAKGVLAADLTNATLSAQFEYDKAGNLVRSNAEAGVYRRYGYNLAGAQVREERDWTDGATNRTAIYSQTVDKLGRVTSIVSPSWSTTVSATATTSLSLDRWGNVLQQTDALGRITQFFYNDQSKLIRQVAPQVAVVSESGVTTNVSPETKWYYDSLGRLFKEIDANGHTQSYSYDVANRLMTTTDANSKVSRTAYDALGQAIATQDALNYLSYVDYDAGGRAVMQGDFLLNVAGNGRDKNKLQTFTLDQDGNRLTVKDALNNMQKYDFDARGLMLRSETAAGVVKTFTYDLQGRKTQEKDGLNAILAWTYDYFGRVKTHTDMSGLVFTSNYDARSGLITSTTATGASRTMTYYANGQVKSMAEDGSTYLFEYDSVGNKTLEDSTTTDGAGLTVHVVNRTYYDAQNRITRITSDDTVNSIRILDLNYYYDAVGNRRRVVADSSYGPGAAPPTSTPNHQDYWFSYDNANRVLVSNGMFVAGAIKVSGTKAWGATYNDAGYQVSRYIDDAGTLKMGVIHVDLRGQRIDELHVVAIGAPSGGIAKTYTYDAAGHLTLTKEYYAAGTTKSGRARINEWPYGFANYTFDTSGWLSRQETYTYDADGRAATIDTWGRAQFWGGDVAQTLEDDPLADPNDFSDYITQLSTVFYTTSSGATGYDAAGRLITHRVFHNDNEAQSGGELGPAFTSTFTHTYIGKEGWIEKTTTGTPDNTTYREGSTTSTFDAWGNRETLEETTPLKDYDTTLTYRRYFSYDANGGILTRRDGTMENNVWTQSGNGLAASKYNPAPLFITSTQWNAMSAATRKTWQGKGLNQHFVYSNGQQVAQLNEAGMLNVADLLTGFDSSELGAGMVTVMEDETLKGVAQRVYGNSSLWYVLAEANAVSEADIFTGQMLKVPEVKTSKNDATTFKPYNPAEATGPLDPSTPYITPPPKAQCDAMMMILMVAVIVIATVATAGAAAVAMSASAQGIAFGAAAAQAGGIMAAGGAALTGGAIGSIAATAATATTAATAAMSVSLTAAGTFAAGFAGGLIGSVAGQVVGKAVGLVDHFSLRQAVGSGLTSGLTAGIGEMVGVAKFGALARGAASGAIGSASSYAGNRIAGVEGTSFSWKSIAASVVSSTITAGITKKIGFEPKDLGGRFANDVFNGLVGGVVNAQVRHAFGFDDEISYANIAADAFGNAFGNAVVGGLTSSRAVSDLARKTRQVLDGAGIEYTVDRFGRPITYSKSALDTIHGLLASGHSVEDITTVVGDTSMQSLFSRADLVNEHLSDSAELASREHIHYENGVVAFPIEDSPPATSVPLSQPTPALPGGSGGDNFIVNTVNNVLTPVADAAADLSAFAERHPTSTKVIDIGFQGAMIALFGPINYIKDKVIDGVVGPYIEQGNKVIADFYQSKGVRQGASILAAAGTLFATFALAGKIGNSLKQGQKAADFRRTEELARRQREIDLNSSADAEAGMPVGPRHLFSESQRHLLMDGPGAHAVQAHGGRVTDAQLRRRAYDGLRADDVQGNVPSASSAFHSDEMLAMADDRVRKSGVLENCLAMGQVKCTVKPGDVGDLGADLGRAYLPVDGPGVPVGREGPLLRRDNIRSVQGVYKYDSASKTWYTYTLYPEWR